MPPLLVLAGATATGKTALALALAERLGAVEIVSADSRQIYRGFDIGTAKVTAVERAAVPHHGIDLTDADAPFSAADWRRHALDALAGIAERGRLAILAGGTGLYLRAIARGLPLDETGRDDALRATLEARLDAEGLPALVGELRRVAPGIAAATDLANPRRVVRALERAHLGGDHPPPPPRGYPAPVAWIGLRREIAEHDRAIAERAAAQLRGGLLAETEALLHRYPDRTLRAWSAMGYREAFAVLDGTATLDEAIAADAARTRAFARRQAIWFRSEPGIDWIDLPATGGGEALARTLPVAEALLAGASPRHPA